MRYQVPQFIEIEDKVFGPLTIKQFLYLIGGVGISFLLYSFLPKVIGIAIALPVLVFFVALAFYEYNGKPFIFTVENAVKYFFGPKLYLWKKQERKPEKGERKSDIEKIEDIYVPKISQSKLKELSWSLDIHEKSSKR